MSLNFGCKEYKPAYNLKMIVGTLYRMVIKEIFSGAEISMFKSILALFHRHGYMRLQKGSSQKRAGEQMPEVS